MHTGSSCTQINHAHGFIPLINSAHSFILEIDRTTQVHPTHSLILNTGSSCMEVNAYRFILHKHHPAHRFILKTDSSCTEVNAHRFILHKDHHAHRFILHIGSSCTYFHCAHRIILHGGKWQEKQDCTNQDYISKRFRQMNFQC